MAVTVSHSHYTAHRLHATNSCAICPRLSDKPAEITEIAPSLSDRILFHWRHRSHFRKDVTPTGNDAYCTRVMEYYFIIVCARTGLRTLTAAPSAAAGVCPHRACAGSVWNCQRHRPAAAAPTISSHQPEVGPNAYTASSASVSRTRSCGQPVTWWCTGAEADSRWTLPELVRGPPATHSVQLSSMCPAVRSSRQSTEPRMERATVPARPLGPDATRPKTAPSPDWWARLLAAGHPLSSHVRQPFPQRLAEPCCRGPITIGEWGGGGGWSPSSLRVISFHQSPQHSSGGGDISGHKVPAGGG